MAITRQPVMKTLRHGSEFGKLVKIQEVENQIITHYEVFTSGAPTRRFW